MKLFSALTVTSANAEFEFVDSATITLTCSLTNILEETTVAWYNGDTEVVDASGFYKTDTQALEGNSKTSELEITSDQLKLLTDKTFKCSSTIDSITVASEFVTLTILGK